RARHRHEVGLVLLLRGRAARAGSQQREGVPGRAPGARQGDRGQDLYGARAEPRPRRADRGRGGRGGGAGAGGGVTVANALDPELRLQHALDRAFRYLGRRDRTVLEMRRYLEGKRVEPCAIDAALAVLARDGYLDDARFARQFAEDKRLLEEWGADRIER